MCPCELGNNFSFRPEKIDTSRWARPLKYNSREDGSGAKCIIKHQELRELPSPTAKKAKLRRQLRCTAIVFRRVWLFRHTFRETHYFFSMNSAYVLHRRHMLRPLSFTLSARKTERGAIERERFDFAKPTSLSRQRGAGSTAFMRSL